MRLVRWTSYACIVVFGACGDDAATDAGADAGPTVTTFSREKLLDPETCKDCHPRHYREWASSMHAYASEDPVFLAMNRRGQEETKDDDKPLGDFCVKCHAPMAVREGATTDGLNLDDVPAKLKGVTCYFCHNVKDVEGEHNNPLVLANDTTMLGGIANAKRPRAHGVAYSALHDGNTHESASLCGSCHDIVNHNGVHLERTFAEWKDSVFSAPTPAEGFLSCNQCHMSSYDGVAAVDPEVRVGQRLVHEHLWPSVDVALTPFPDKELQLAATECALSTTVLVYSLVVDPTSITVIMESQSGHRTPSGAAQDRRLWAEVIAYDAAGTKIFQSGEIADDEVEEKPEGDPDHDPYLWMFRDRIYDADGNETHMFWEAAKSAAHPDGYETNTMPGTIEFGQPHTVKKTYPVFQPARVTLRVRLRPMGLDVLDDLIESGHLDPAIRDAMPTHTLASAAREWTLSEDGYGAVITSSPSYPDACLRYRCLLDPDAVACE